MNSVVKSTYLYDESLISKPGGSADHTHVASFIHKIFYTMEYALQTRKKIYWRIQTWIPLIFKY